MKDERRYSLAKLSDALNKLKEGCAIAQGELEKDGVIQRFEFTFELLWKTLRIFLRDKGVDTKTPKDSLKEAFRIGWIQDEHVFLKMLDDRNEMSHVYSHEKSVEIFNRIKSDYLKSIENVTIELQKAL